MAKHISCFELQNNTQEQQFPHPYLCSQLCDPGLYFCLPVCAGTLRHSISRVTLGWAGGLRNEIPHNLQLTEVLRLVSGQALGQPLGFTAINCSKLESLQLLSTCVKGIRAKIRGRNRVRQQGCKAFCERSDFKGKNPFSGWCLGRNSEPH